MCKFNHSLFLISVMWYSLWLLLTQVTVLNGHPLDALLSDDYADEETADYDLVYDQRQNGTENFRLRIDGVVIALPSSISGSAASLASSVSTDYLLALASSSNSEEDKEDDKDDDNFIDYLKYQKSGGSKVTSENQSKEGTEKEENKEKTVKKDIKPVETNDGHQKEEKPIKEENSTELRNTAATDKANKKQIANKSQGRRRNKFKLRLGGLLDFLSRSRE